MSRVLDPFRFVLIAVAGWMNHPQLQIIDYLREENRVFREQLGGRRCVSTTTSAVDWPPRPKVWDESFWQSSPPSSRRRPYWPGIGS